MAATELVAMVVLLFTSTRANKKTLGFFQNLEEEARGASPTARFMKHDYFLACDSALAAMDRVRALERPSRNAFEALRATEREVVRPLDMESPPLTKLPG
jgi:hypothetical protein